ncbi:MAG: isopentenyl-diphosphate Delta-isomerase [Oceanicaulis sp.]
MTSGGPDTPAGGSPDDRLIPAIGPDGARFPVDKLDAHRRGLLHDAVSVFLFDQGGDMLLQRRAGAKYHCPGLWANACCTHPDWGEDAAAGAARRLGEELGLAPAPALEEMGVTTYRADVGGGLVEHERVRLFRAVVDRASMSFALNPDEVSEVRWTSPAALHREALARPHALAPWLRIYLERWDRLGLAA